jgi:hypothetical protein
MADLEKFRAFALAKIAKTKNPLGSTTVGLVGKTAQKKMASDLFTLEALLTRLRKEGALYCTRGRWWVPK